MIPPFSENSALGEKSWTDGDYEVFYLFWFSGQIRKNKRLLLKQLYSCL